MDILPSTIMRRAVLPVANPAVNTEWSSVVAASEEFTAGGWLVKAVAASLAAGSTAVQPVLIIDDGGTNVIAESVGATASQPSGTCQYTWAEGLVQSGIQGSGADQHSQSPLPMGDECYLQAGWRVRSHTLGLNSTSQWSAIVLYLCYIG